MPAWLLVTTLMAAPGGDGWSPAEAPPPTPWAMANARGWRLCQEAERRAVAFRSGAGGPRGGNRDEDRPWQRYARQCPHAVEVLVAAGQDEIIVAAELFRDVEFDELEPTLVAKSLDRVIEQHDERLSEALGWLEASIAESARRGQRPPREALYYRAYALAALGRVGPAREAIAQVIEAGDVERWRSERMAALVELCAGDIDQALRRAQRGVYDAPPDDRGISRFIRALVLDRAGASAVARAELRSLQRLSGSVTLQRAMESVLPIHEQLFFRALYAQANDLRSPALRFWQAYLARPEPQEPERVLAQRHLDELTPPPAPAGGP